GHPVRLLRGGRRLSARLSAQRLGKREEFVHRRRPAIGAEAQLVDEAAERAPIEGLARPGADNAGDLDAKLRAGEAQRLAVALEARSSSRFPRDFRLRDLKGAEARGEGGRLRAFADLEAGLFRLVPEIERELGIGARVAGGLTEIEARKGAALTEVADREAVDAHRAFVAARDGARQTGKFRGGQVELDRGLSRNGSARLRRGARSCFARTARESPKAEKDRHGGAAEPERGSNAERSRLNGSLARIEEPVFFHSADAHHATPLTR